MKRPEGFDRRATPPPVAQKRTRGQRAAAAAEPALSATVTAIATPAAALNDARATTPIEPHPAPKPSMVSVAREGRSLLRRAARVRKAFERGEVKRFTRRARARRRVLVGAIVTVLTLVVGMLVAVFSPLLSLETIEITGTNRISASEVQDALDGQVGRPLALIDFAEITRQLATFPLVRSYTTETVPPHTLVIAIQERAPIGLINNGASFDVVDPAGIVIESVSARPDGLPVIDAGSPSIKNTGFTAAVEVLLALPPDLLLQVDTISASTKDDVGFTLGGGSQSVTWGSADRSDTKARVLATLVAAQGSLPGLLYDVSAPDAAVVRSL